MTYPPWVSSPHIAFLLSYPAIVLVQAWEGGAVYVPQHLERSTYLLNTCEKSLSVSLIRLEVVEAIYLFQRETLLKEKKETTDDKLLNS